MAKETCKGATLKCSNGTAPSKLVVISQTSVNTENNLAATINDHIPFTNILPFGLCTSSANPLVSAAFGAPQPCTPVVPAPWSSGCSDVLICGKKALNDNSTCSCVFAQGTISIDSPGQNSVDIPS